jgi:hypothetical protein
MESYDGSRPTGNTRRDRLTGFSSWVLLQTKIGADYGRRERKTNAKFELG